MPGLRSRSPEGFAVWCLPHHVEVPPRNDGEGPAFPSPEKSNPRAATPVVVANRESVQSLLEKDPAHSRPGGVPAPVIDDPSPIDVHRRSIIGFGRQRVFGALVDPKKTLPLYGELVRGFRFASHAKSMTNSNAGAGSWSQGSLSARSPCAATSRSGSVVCRFQVGRGMSQKSDLFRCHLELHATARRRARQSVACRPIPVSNLQLPRYTSKTAGRVRSQFGNSRDSSWPNLPHSSGSAATCSPAAMGKSISGRGAATPSQRTRSIDTTGHRVRPPHVREVPFEGARRARSWSVRSASDAGHSRSGACRDIPRPPSQRAPPCDFPSHGGWPPIARTQRNSRGCLATLGRRSQWR